jgi:ABC-type polysaccharide/polyol phosphate export permease
MFQDLSKALTDLVDGARLAPLWWRVGIDQIASRFRRTLLGPIWMVGSLLATSFALGYVFSGLFGTDYRTTFSFLITGVLSWYLLGGSSNEAAAAFTGSASLMQVQKLPLSFYVYLHMQRQFLNFVPQLLAFFLATALLRLGRIPTWIFVPGFILDMMVLFFVSFIIGIAATRFRDIGHMVGVIMQLLFFMTPIFWKPEQLPAAKRFVVEFNPFWHLMELLRQPLLGAYPATEHWVWASGILVVTASITVITLTYCRKRVVFWL